MTHLFSQRADGMQTLDQAFHFETVALLASSSLERGEPAAAFRFADRRCRYVAPNARDLLLRAEASRLSGHLRYALDDLSRAFENDPTDILVNRSIMKWGLPAARLLAAAELTANSAVDAETLKQALAVLHAQGNPINHSLERLGGRIRGWIVWKGSQPLHIRVRALAGESETVLSPNDNHSLADPRWSAAELSIEDDAYSIRGLDLVTGGSVLERIVLPSLVHPSSKKTPLAASPAGEWPKLVSIIVPMYEDYELSRRCLDALMKPSAVETRIIAIDDNSPNATLRAHLRDLELSQKIILLRNETNLGFAASVNRGLQRCDFGDVVLVNSDALLPPGAIDQMVAAAYSNEAIGTVTPFSNNGEAASFPSPNQANPLPTLEEITNINQKSAAANGSSVVDIPSGIGFCLYIRQACLASVGSMPTLYSRGYFEDVEFCLKANEKGFRNVCAVGTFVGHAGASSFRAGKRSLVIRNRAIIEQRFPEYRGRCDAFTEADPLKEARARIERHTPPRREVVLICSKSALSRTVARRRSLEINANEDRFLVLHGVANIIRNEIELRGAGEDAPRSLSFCLNGGGMQSLSEYLAALDLYRVEILDAGALPEMFLDAILALSAPIELLWSGLPLADEISLGRKGACLDLKTAGPCADCLLKDSPAHRQLSSADPRERQLLAVLERAVAIRPMDRLAGAYCRQRFEKKQIPFGVVGTASAKNTRDGVRTGLGILSPARSGSIDRQIVALGRQFIRSNNSNQIVVFGQCVDDLALMSLGNVFVTGPLREEEYERLLQQYEIGALLAPYRTGFFGLLDELAVRADLPKAYFDWSRGALAVDAGDLAMDPRICDAKAGSAIEGWCRASDQLVGRGIAI